MSTHLFTGRIKRTSEQWQSRGDALTTERWIDSTKGIRLVHEATSGVCSVVRNEDGLMVDTRCLEIGAHVGHRVTKDMTHGLADPLDAEAAPLNVAIPEETHTATFWDDWGNDIFDDWGFFYIFDVASQTYFFPILTQINREDGDLATEEFTAFEGIPFTIVHGYIAQGIYKFDVRCGNPETTFIFGAYGDMGSDDDTINTNLTHPYTIEGRPMTLYYNRNVERNDEIERFFSYFVPYETSITTKTYSDFSYNEDKLSLYSVPVTNGIIVYFSKMNDVREWVVRDLKGTTRADVLNVNGHAIVRGTVDASRVLVGGTDLLPTGTIIWFPVSEAPSGYLLCDGSAYDIDDYPALARLLGVTPSEEVREFSVPNLPSVGPSEEVLVYFMIRT